ncbi:MAG: 2-oxo acid dehydrogenase subunit E2 [Actinomycetota bacterium]|nr:2-oxo acid dehydrogenase subunit E2 [Actinomycetota bacterium]
MPTFEQFRLPDAGEGLTEADIVEWRVAVGDAVTVNQTIVEVETAKSLVELPSPFTGVVAEILVAPGATVEVGTPIIVIDTDPDGEAVPSADDGAALASVSSSAADGAPEADADSSGAVLVGYGTVETGSARRPRRAGTTVAASTSPAPAASTASVPSAASSSAPSAVSSSAPSARTPGSSPSSAGSTANGAAGRFDSRTLAKPPVRKLAKELGVDLDSVTPTGPGGIVTREDLLAHSRSAEPRALATYPGDDSPWLASGSVSPDGRQTRVPVKSVRKRTAEAMVSSAFTAPHVTVFHTIDVTKTMRLVTRLREDREFADVRVTPLLIVAKALLLAVHRHPEINASWDDESREIVYKHYVNLGIAAATPRGLVVPNVKDAHRMTLKELAEALTELTLTARAGKTSPADLSDGTITITNVGAFGIDTGTPILNPGEAAILAFGAVREQPWVHKGKIKVRQVTQLALSFDHRLVDGELGSRLLADVAKILEDPSQFMVWA